jgi:signal transduction histidine kinase
MTASPAARLRHDLRTPVNHILGYGEMLLEDAEATGRAGRAASLARILDLAREMIVVINGPAKTGHDLEPIPEVELLAARSPSRPSPAGTPPRSPRSST